MINTKLQSIIDTKSAIGNAITNKGGTITTNTPFFNYAAEIDNISTGGGAYSTFVAQAQDNSLYTVYNGYDYFSNPTPNLSNNFAFNRWLLNNSATGDVVLSNVVVANSGTFNGPNVTFNQNSMPLFRNFNSYGGFINTITSNNGFVYIGGLSNLAKYNESTGAFVGNVSYGASIRSITTNNGFIYVVGQNPGVISKFYESNLGFVANSASYTADVWSVTTNNGFVYIGGSFIQTVQKFYESNLAFVGNTVSYGGNVRSIIVNDGSIYVGGQGNGTVKKFNDNNLAFVSNSAFYGTDIFSIASNNGFIYAGGGPTNVTIQKFFESNLVRATGTNVSSSYGGTIQSLTTNNGFVYAGGNTTNLVRKYNESNLSVVGNSGGYGGNIFSIHINNGFIYAGGATTNFVRQYEEAAATPTIETFYNITNIKE
jgi:hypothetical protein